MKDERLILSHDNLREVTNKEYNGRLIERHRNVGTADSDRKNAPDVGDRRQPNIFKLLWPAIFVDFWAGIAIPILLYYMLELPCEEGTKCPTCPQTPGLTLL